MIVDFFCLSLVLEYNLNESLLPEDDGYGISEKQHLPRHLVGLLIEHFLFFVIGACGCVDWDFSCFNYLLLDACILMLLLCPLLAHGAYEDIFLELLINECFLTFLLKKKTPDLIY